MLAEVQLDGFVDEWSDLIGEPTLTTLDFTHRTGAGSSRPTRSVGYRLPGSGWPGTMIRTASMSALVAADDDYKNTHTYDVDWIDLIKK